MSGAPASNSSQSRSCSSFIFGLSTTPKNWGSNGEPRSTTQTWSGVDSMASVRLGTLAGLLLALASGGPPGFAAHPGAPLVLEETISLKDVSGRIDHMAID